MRILVLSLILLLAIIASCNAPKEKDSSKIDQLIISTDSLLDISKAKFDAASEEFYLLIEDSTKIDSFALILNIPDSNGIYQYVEKGVGDLEELVLLTQKEIQFLQENLQEVKTSLLEDQLSKSEYLKLITESKELLIFLQERLDSNIFLIERKYNNLLNSRNDTLSHNE